MSDKNPHIIKAQAFQIEIAAKEDAHRVQSNISALQSTRISQLIDRILNEYHDPDWVFAFDQVELDLGTVSKYNYENEIVYRLEEALINFLKQSISKNGSIRRGEKRRVEMRRLEQLEHFLEKGYMDWNSKSKESPAQLLNHLIANEEMVLLASLRRLAKREQIRKRIVYHFDEPELEKIVHITAGSHAGYILEHKQNIIRRQQQDEMVVTSSGSFDTLVWEIIMAYLFAEGRSYFDKKSYLNYLITQIARHHNLTYHSLLLSVSEGINKSSTKGGENVEFAKIIRELRLEAEVPPPFKVAFINEQKDSFDSFINIVETYLNKGQFTREFGSISKEEFNSLFRHFMLNNGKELIRRSDAWLTDSKKVKRLVQILNAGNRKDLVFKNKSSLTVSALNFLDAILIPKKRSRAGQTKLISFLEDLKFEMILVSLPKSNNKEELLLEVLLHEICQQAVNREDEVFELLSDRLEEVPSKYKIALEDFLVSFYQKIGANVLESISSEVLTFLDNHPFEKWNNWFTYRMKRWQQITGLSEITLRQHIWKTIRNEFDEFEAVRVLKALPQAWSRDLHLPMMANIKQNDLSLEDRRKFATMMNVIEHGYSPWWDPSYSVARFNRELVEYITAASTGVSEIKKVLRKSTANYHLISWLYPATEKKLWQVLGSPSMGSIMNLVQELTKELQSNFVLPGIISVRKYDELRSELMRLLVFSEKRIAVTELIRTLTNWISTTSTLHRETTRNIFVELLSTVSQRSSDSSAQQEFTKWIKSFTKISESHETESLGAKTLSDYLAEFNIQLYERGGNTYYDDIISMITDSSVPFDSLLGKIEFREALLAELTIPESRKVISTQLNSRQQEYFQQTYAYLDMLNSKLSIKEFGQIQLKFTKTIFLRIGSKSNSAWKLSDWVKLVIQILYETVGVSKSDSLILDICETQSMSGTQIVKIFEDQCLNVAPKIIPSEEQPARNPEPEKNYRKLGEESNFEFMNPLFINNAGLIILAPYLGVLFERCGLTTEGKFIDEQAEFMAIQLLDYAATGQTNAGEHELVLQKILCGIPVQRPVDISVEIDDDQKAIVDDLLIAITQQWPGLENTTIDALRGSFLIRDGKLEEVDDSIHLKIEQRPFDMLLDRIPWNISSIKLSWMPKLLQVEWR